MKKIKISFFMLCFFMVAGISNQVYAQSAFVEDVSGEYATIMKTASVDMVDDEQAVVLLFQELEQLKNANPSSSQQEATVSAKYNFVESMLVQLKLKSNLQDALYTSFNSTKSHCMMFKGVNVDVVAILGQYVEMLKK